MNAGILDSDDTVPNDWPGLRERPYTGPVTGQQLAALDMLEEIAMAQDVQVTTELPPYTGPMTGDQLGLLGTGERGAIEVAEREMAPRGRGAHHRRRPFRAPSCWPLLAVLVVQAGLSLRLVWSNTAFPDEALYLWAGHLEWSHWLHGTPAPDFATYFSGAPVVYPPIGALADAAGGLAAARLVSMLFMLGATTLLYSLTKRIFDERSALFAAALFAATAATEFLGAFATYDAMSLGLLALAAWLGVRAAACRQLFPAMCLVGASAVALALADAAKYAGALFDPVVIGVVFLAAWHLQTKRRGLMSLAMALSVLASAVAIGLRLGGRSYWHGISLTTLGRPSSGAPAVKILVASGEWVGIVLLLAVVGALVVQNRKPGLPLRLAAWLLAGAVCLVPLEQARIGVSTSLFKHVGFGAWFGAIVAGYALASLCRAVPKAKVRQALQAGFGAVAVSAAIAIGFAGGHFTSWPNTTGLVSEMRTVLQSHRGPILATDDGQVIEYYLPGELEGTTFYGLWFFRYQDPQTGRHSINQPAYADAIRHRYFSVVALSYSDTIPMDDTVTADIAKYGGYKLVAVIPYQISSARYPATFKVWVREGGAK